MRDQAKTLAAEFTSALVEGAYDRAYAMFSAGYRATHHLDDVRREFERMCMRCKVSQFEADDFVEDHGDKFLVHVYLTLDGADPEELAVFVDPSGSHVTNVWFGRP